MRLNLKSRVSFNGLCSRDMVTETGMLLSRRTPSRVLVINEWFGIKFFLMREVCCRSVICSAVGHVRCDVWAFGQSKCDVGGRRAGQVVRAESLRYAWPRQLFRRGAALHTHA